SVVSDDLLHDVGAGKEDVNLERSIFRRAETVPFNKDSLRLVVDCRWIAQIQHHPHAIAAWPIKKPIRNPQVEIAAHVTGAFKTARKEVCAGTGSIGAEREFGPVVQRSVNRS